MVESEQSFLPREVREGLTKALERDRRATGGRLRVQVGETWYPIRSYDSTGFEVGLEIAPRLRGHVEIHEGARLIRTALIVAGEMSAGSLRYGFKRVTDVRHTAPVDYVRATEEPSGYLGAP